MKVQMPRERPRCASNARAGICATAAVASMARRLICIRGNALNAVVVAAEFAVNKKNEF